MKRKLNQIYARDDQEIKQYSKEIRFINKKSYSCDETQEMSFEERIIEIARNGYEVELKSLLKRYPELVNTRDEKGNTILQLAALSDTSAMVQYILNNYPELALATNKNNETVLYKATQANNTKNLDLLLNFMIKTDNLELIENQDIDGDTVLHLATLAHNPKAIKKIIKVCPKLGQITNNHQDTPLHSAARIDCLEALKILIKQYPDLLKAKDDQGDNVLSSAILCDSTNVIEFLTKADHELVINQNTEQSRSKSLEIGHINIVNGNSDSQVKVIEITGDHNEL